MNLTITSLGGRAPPSRNTPSQSQDLVRAPQLEVLALELLQPRPLVRRQSGPLTRVTLGLPHPVAERLGRAAQLLGNRADRCPL